jgi:hypothetical protein
MKRASAIVITLCLLFVAGAAGAQPYIMVYYNDLYTVGNKDCPAGTPGTVLDTVYVVAKQFDRFFCGVEYSIVYPSQMTYQEEDPTSDLYIGDTVNGIAQAWSTPQNGFKSVLLNKIYFLWNCDGCGTSDIPIVVAEHPDFSLGAVAYPSNQYFNVIGMTSLICGTTPERQTTWGNIKALYSE